MGVSYVGGEGVYLLRIKKPKVQTLLKITLVYLSNINTLFFFLENI